MGNVQRGDLMAMDDESASGPSYRLILSFPDQTANFANGFAAGKLWADMTRGDVAELRCWTSVDNREVIERIAHHLGWDRELGETIDGWDDTRLIKCRPEQTRYNPHGIHVVRTR
jgi:hypothetical protein